MHHSFSSTPKTRDRCGSTEQGTETDHLSVSQERHGLQVLLDDGVHHHLKDNLDVGGVRCRGEVMVDQFPGRRVEGDEGGCDEPGS